MNNATLPVFDADQFQRANIFLATRVSEMMGRKLEEGDWAQVYCAAKGIPLAGWSNTDIDVMFGNLGVEQKAMCRRATQPIKDSCGTTIMHPAGTRAIRIPAEEDPTTAARNILRQYGELIARRRTLVDVVNRFSHGVFTRSQAVADLQKRIVGMSKASAENRIPADAVPVGNKLAEPDLRIGWLLWQDTLREFLYFEERMVAPDPDKYIARWNVRPGGGSRIGSRNLWIYEEETGEKHFSVTTEAGAKIQPYFRVPGPNDPNLYHFVVQGEDMGNGMIRVWLTQSTANLLKQAVGSMDPADIAKAIEAVRLEEKKQADTGQVFGVLAVEILIPVTAYAKLKSTFDGVSDEHNFKQLIDSIQSTTEA
jgi:hypothetical protein